MRKLACLFFPEEDGVVKGMEVRAAENIGALEADVGLAVPAARENSSIMHQAATSIA